MGSTRFDSNGKIKLGTKMKNQTDILFLLLSFLALSFGQEQSLEKRDPKQFSLFSIVTFKNAECSSASTSDQHVYIDSGRASTAATLAFTFGSAGSGTANVWRIKVSLIECWSATRAPPGCLQYFYGGTRHTVKSFGWDGTKTYSTGGSLAKMYYTTCFRPEKGMCGQYFAQSPVSSSLDAFELGNEGDDELSDYDEECEKGYIQIHSTWEEAKDLYCGGYLAEDSGEDEDSRAGAVHAMTANAWSFQTMIEADTEEAYTGYSIDAQQTA